MPDLGQWFGERGYLAAYTGKWHVGGRDAHKSFTTLTLDPSKLGEHSDPAVSRSAEAFLRNYDGDKRSSCRSASCSRTTAATGGSGARGHRVAAVSVHRGRPSARTGDPAPEAGGTPYDVSDSRAGQAARDPLWSDLQWRYYIWAYYGRSKWWTLR